MLRPRVLTLLALSASLSAAEVLGPLYPAPVDLTSDESIVKKAWNDLTSTLDTYFVEGQNSSAFVDLALAENITWSAGVFSLHDAEATELQYHYTSPEIAQTAIGTGKVDADSIYRVASISKLITAYVGMQELTQKQWHTPISELIPGLGKGGDAAEDPLSASPWDTITPWSLVNHQAGITTNGIPIYDLIGQGYAAIALETNTSAADLEVADGFPPVPFSDLGPCGSFENAYCAADDFLESVKNLHPNLLPWTTPAYANFGFMLLGLAISNVTGKSYDELYYGSVFEPLGMSSSHTNAPTSGEDFERGVVVPPSLVEGGFVQMGSQIAVPTGGILSTINDLAKLGLGIMNSTLLSPQKTREWMKPHSNTASLTYSVGAPWEIIRYVHADTGRVTDIYTKSGDSGNQGGILVLIPDYNAGFSMLNAANALKIPARGEIAFNIINRIAEAVVPALEAQAMVEAKRNFAGDYACPDKSLNSSIEITFNETTIDGRTSPALSVSRWISNGTDMLPQVGGVKPQLQLTIPKPGDGPGSVAFRAFQQPQWKTYMEADLGAFSGFYSSNFGWLTVDQARYGGNGVGTLVFDVDGDGMAMAVREASTKTMFRREGS